MLFRSRNFEANYPEVVEAAFVVNAPAIFSIIYRVLSPIFAPCTLAKFKFFGCNTAEWQAELRKMIPGDQLPVKYGGSQSAPVNVGDNLIVHANILNDPC